MTPEERVVAVAKEEDGYLEKKTNAMLDDKTANAGSNNWTKYARDLDVLGVYDGKKNGYAWCDVFVDWCFIKAFGLEIAMKMLNQPMGGYGAGCTCSMNYYKQAGRFYTSSPKIGDQIFFTNDGGKTSNHTGLVIDVKCGNVCTTEGNTSSQAGVVANGGCVRHKSYSLSYSKIAGYGRPDYSIVRDVVEEEEDMTKEQFKKMYDEMRADWQDNDCGTWSQQARDWATSTKLIAGSGTLPDGEPNYMWSDTLTREQAAALFFRFAQMMGKA